MDNPDPELAMMPTDLQAAFEQILKSELTAACARCESAGIAPFTTMLGLCQATVQTFLQISRPLTLRMLRHYLDAMEAPAGSTKNRHHTQKFAAAAAQLAQVMVAQRTAGGSA